MLSTLSIIQSADSGLTFGEMVRDIPHDGAAIVAYILIIAFAWLIWRGNRPKKST